MVRQSMKLSCLFKTKRGAPKLPRPCQFLPYCAQPNTLSFRKANPVSSDPTSPTFGSNRFTTSPSFSSSVETPDLLDYCDNDDGEHGYEKLVRGVVNSSERLFFEPNGDTGLLKVMPDGRGISEAEDSEETEYQKERKRKGKEKVEEDDGEAAPEVSLFESSMFLPLDSNDPYKDFKKSMEEMVEFLGLKDSKSLEELLRCYLGVNDEKNHYFIFNAFFDLFSIGN
ncbi:hypothetical protein QN277_000876 [Acacia crassicarpa]|uniref:Transcription repressor n=1 Tax=Acacia crassicarpa TaxID=499986 RepID=A0AAE1N8L0_9FABA|nr:hypothetical protein QN277_000876 [Acacia crassicarpa]